MSRLFKLSEMISNGIDNIANSYVIKSTLTNPLLASIIISLLVVAIIIIIFRRETLIHDEPSRYYLKIGAFVFLLLSSTFFFQNYLMVSEIKQVGGSHEFDTAFDIYDHESADYLDVSNSASSTNDFNDNSDLI